MSEQQVSGISVRDLRDALDACYEDQGARVRMVLWAADAGPRGYQLQIAVQACNERWEPVGGIPAQRQVWPNNQFRTLTQALWTTVYQLYGTLEYMRYREAQGARDAANNERGA